MAPGPTMLMLLVACAGDPEPDDSSAEGEPREAQDSDEPVVLGCVLGNARDDYNVGEVNVPVRAFAPDTCELVGETTGDAAGDFCLDGLPAGLVEVQLYYAEGRCAWWHGVTANVTEGDCGEPTTCLDLGTLFECYADPPVCEG